MRRIPGFRRASIKEVEKLSKLAWVRDEELSTRGDEARVLPDGRVLLYVGDSDPAALYPSREALAEMRRQIAEEMAKGPVDLSRTLLPPIDDFLRDVEAHAKSLGPRLGIADVLDFTPESLDAVDKALKRIPWAKRQVPDLVTPLIAYVGEVMRRASGGQWTKPPAANDNEPMIKGRDGGFLQPYVPVVLPMVEPSRRIPLRAAVDVYLLPYRAGSSAAGGV
jgi:hypothetical protein